MVPLNGALVRLSCKCLLLLSPVVLFLFWFTSQRNQSSIEVDQLEQRLSFSLDQLDSMHTQIDVITQHKEKIEHLLEEERERFAKERKDREKRILHLEAENSRLSRINRDRLDVQMNRSASNSKVASVPAYTFNKTLASQAPNNNITLFHLQADSTEKRMNDPFDGHQIRGPPLPNEEEKQLGIRRDFEKGEEREDIGAEKDYIFAREKPREDLVFRRANDSNGMSGQPHFRSKMMENAKTKGHKTGVEEDGRETFGVGEGGRVTDHLGGGG